MTQFRERAIMSLISFVGATENILTETPIHCRQIALPHPVLTVHEFDKLRFVDKSGFQAKTINAYFRADQGEKHWKELWNVYVAMRLMQLKMDLKLSSFLIVRSTPTMRQFHHFWQLLPSTII